MKVEEMEILANKGARMPEGLNGAEQILFLGLRRLYAYAKISGMSPEEGRQEKSSLLKEFGKRNLQLARAERTDRMWKEIEAASTRFAKERTLESAEAFFRAVYGVGLLPPGGRIRMTDDETKDTKEKEETAWS